jgi:protocatechuate 3,4-dioxygenase beta subunit
MVTYIPNAKVELYRGESPGSDHIDHAIETAMTDKKGSVLFESIDPGQYTLTVDTPLGQKSRMIYTQINKRASIDFSF